MRAPLRSRPERSGDERAQLRPEPAPPPSAQALVAIQQSAGNAAAQRLLRKTTKPPPKPPQPFFTDAAGALHAADDAGATVRVGTVAGTTGVVAVDEAGKKAVAIADAVIGSVRPGPVSADEPIARVKAVTVAAAAAPASGATAPAGLTPAEVKLTGQRLGVLVDVGKGTFGDQVLTRGAKWEPIQYGKLSTALQTALKTVPEAHLDLGETGFWALMDFHLRDETKDTTRWVAAKEGFAKQEQKTEKDAEKLPPDLRTKFGAYLETVTAVLTHEGTYGSRSIAGDTAASLGIFQWAANKTGDQGAGSSLGMFFKDLKRSANDAKKAAKPSEEQKLYINAWEQCTKAGLDVDSAGTISLGGKVATGKEIEDKMSGNSGPMASDALKTYQLVAAMDWIDAFRGTVVRPGPSAEGKVGHEYTERNKDGTSVTFEVEAGGVKYSFPLTAPTPTATVGDLLRSGKNTALAVTLGVNRPHYVEAALWLAVSNRADPKADTAALLAKLVAAVEAADAAAEAAAPTPPKKKKRKPKNRTINAADVATAKTDHDALLRLVWPAAPALTPAAEEKLANEFKRRALLLYKPSDAREYGRERRFATVEAIFD